MSVSGWRQLVGIFHQYTRLAWISFLGATLLCLPFHKIFPVFPLLLTGLFALLSGLSGPSIRSFQENKRMLLGLLLYIPALYAWYISPDKNLAKTDLQVKFSLWIFPVLLAMNPRLSAKQINRLLQAFAAATVLFVLTSLVYATWQYLHQGYDAFSYKKLVAFTIIHPSYIGMFIDMTIALLLLDMFQPIHDRRWLPRKWTLVIVLLLFVFLILLTAKNAMLLGMLLLVIALFNYVRTTGKWKQAALASLILCSLLSLFIAFNPTARERFTILLRYNDVSYENSVNSRAETWKAVSQLIPQYGWKGAGSGELQGLLDRQYEQNGFDLGVKEHHNAHNQYFQTLLESGIGGLLLYLLCFGTGIWWAVKNKDRMLGAFLLVFLFSILTESMLKTQSGVLFFTLFHAIFLMQLPVKRD